MTDIYRHKICQHLDALIRLLLKSDQAKGWEGIVLRSFATQIPELLRELDNDYETICKIKAIAREVANEQ